MAIEYLYDAIRATSGEDITICAVITDEDGTNITENCHVMLYDDLMLLATINGVYDGKEWEFNIPGNVTSGKAGRFWYCICTNDNSLSFKQPLYLT